MASSKEPSWSSRLTTFERGRIRPLRERKAVNRQKPFLFLYWASLWAFKTTKQALSRELSMAMGHPRALAKSPSFSKTLVSPSAGAWGMGHRGPTRGDRSRGVPSVLLFIQNNCNSSKSPAMNWIKCGPVKEKVTQLLVALDANFKLNLLLTPSLLRQIFAGPQRVVYDLVCLGHIWRVFRIKVVLYVNGSLGPWVTNFLLVEKIKPFTDKILSWRKRKHLFSR